MIRNTKLTAKTREALRSLRAQAALSAARLQLVRWHVLLSVWLARTYLLLAFLALLTTTTLWAYMGAQVHQSNADHLANVYLVEDRTTFHEATFPGQHTFLIKWPLFWLVKVFGATPSAFTWTTVGVVLATVLVVAGVLFSIERRPLRLGSLYLALASILLVVPAQPYAGGILPVNMAMITTRNIEYALYIVALIFLVLTPRLRSWRFWVGAIILGLLVASDKLFLSLSIGGALAACVVYALWQRWRLVTLAARWFVFGIIAAIIASATLFAVNGMKWTHIASGSELSPYGFAHTAKGLELGTVYAGLGLLSNFGANPADDTRLLREIPYQAHQQYLSWGGLALVVNLLVFLSGTFAMLRMLGWSLRGSHIDEQQLGKSGRLALVLSWTAIAACGIFIASNHYYPVDARYLTIVVFAVVVAGTVVQRVVQIHIKVLIITAVVLGLSLMSGLYMATRNFNVEQAALATVTTRNEVVADALTHHPVRTLVGDYWRVLPIKLAAQNQLNVTPLNDCTTPRDILSSRTWQPDLEKTSFAYLLSLDPNLTNSPRCNLQQVFDAYGKPNASVVVAGSLSEPNELLLFYDRGAHHSAPTGSGSPQSVATVVPITPEEMPYITCSGPTIMNVVAHQDDDLLFMSPNLLHDVKLGHCVRTVYVTAGDAGADSFYWLARERGAEAAYSTMLNSSALWIQRIVKLSDSSFITVANPKGNPRISLIFMHLPDGNVRGTGFAASHFESLDRLKDGQIAGLRSVDGSSLYNADQLTAVLTQLMTIYQPAEIRTQSGLISKTAPDHSDHMAVGYFTSLAYRAYESQHFENAVTIPLRYYVGYPTRTMLENVSGSDLVEKEQVLFAYAKYDGGVCSSEESCQRQPNNYRSYLRRQYVNGY